MGQHNESDEEIALRLQAERVEGQFQQQPEGGPQAVAQAATTSADELRALLGVVKAIVSPMSPTIERVWTDQVLDTVAPAASAVMDKYGMTLGGLERWGPEIALAIAVIPPVVATVQGMKMEAEDRRRARIEAQRASRVIPSTEPKVGDGQDR